jgi:hypothetical protein
MEQAMPHEQLPVHPLFRPAEAERRGPARSAEAERRRRRDAFLTAWDRVRGFTAGGSPEGDRLLARLLCDLLRLLRALGPARPLSALTAGGDGAVKARVLQVYRLADAGNAGAVFEELRRLGATDGPPAAGVLAHWLREGLVLEMLGLQPFGAAGGEPADAPEHSLRPCYDRDHLWLRWSEEGMRPAAIRNRWNKEYAQYGGEKIGTGRPGYGVVKQGLMRACKEKQQRR